MTRKKWKKNIRTRNIKSKEFSKETKKERQEEIQRDAKK
jgi:hypothetical protein